MRAIGHGWGCRPVSGVLQNAPANMRTPVFWTSKYHITSTTWQMFQKSVKKAVLSFLMGCIQITSNLHIVILPKAKFDMWHVQNFWWDKPTTTSRNSLFVYLLKNLLWSCKISFDNRIHEIAHSKYVNVRSSGHPHKYQSIA